MKKVIVIVLLISVYVAYSGWVYTSGTACNIPMSDAAIQGKLLWQEYNCQNCHQLYGLGGYMGPDLTTVTTNKQKGILYARGILLSGGDRMPNFHFSEDEVNNILAYLSYVSATSVTLTQ